MLQFGNTNSTMETRDHSKNGASLKSLMSRGNFIIGSLIVLTFLLSSCATTIPMSKKITAEVGVDNTTQFQYYVSKTITLRLVESNVSTTIRDGQLFRSSETAREKIVIKGSLPGVVRSHINLSDNKGIALLVAFENIEGNPTLTFGPSNKGKDIYELYYTDPKNNIVTYGDNQYKVIYDNKSLPGRPPQLKKKTHEGEPYLLIKMKKRHKETDKLRKAKGVKLGQ